jgi:hypothetical protein
MRFFRLVLSLVVVAGVGLGCTESTEVGSNTADVRGVLTPAAGHTVPESAEVFALWMVSAGSPDYGYVFGEGESSGASFGISFDGDLPAEATNRGLGVAFIVLSSTPVAAGRLETEVTGEGDLLGGAAGYAMIWRDPAGLGEMPYREWALDFPVGYSCAELVDEPDTFDSFRPIACEDVEITVADPDTLDFGNWT